MANPARPGRARHTVRRGRGKQFIEGASFPIADEVRYIQHRAADHDGRIASIGQLVLFATNTGDAWLLDPADLLAASPGHRVLRFLRCLRFPFLAVLTAKTN
jgi:hypothetical protein